MARWKCAEIDDVGAGQDNGLELGDGAQGALAGLLGLRVALDLHVVGDDQRGAGPGDLPGDTHGLE